MSSEQTENDTISEQGSLNLKYRLVKKGVDQIDEKIMNVLITTIRGDFKQNLEQVLDEFNEKKSRMVVLQAIGFEIKKLVQVLEAVKLLMELHQYNSVFFTKLEEVYEPLEEGLER